MSTTSGQGNEQNMASGFIAAKLTARRGEWSEVIEWSDPGTVKTTLELSGVGDTRTLSRVWSGEPKGPEALQARLLDVLRAPVAGAGDHVLILSAGGGPSATSTWPIEGEPEPLAKIRAEMERIGHAGFARATLLFERGSQALSNDEHGAAIKDFRAGIAALGSSYRSPSVIDDTGMKLVLAEGEEANGRLKVAANVLSRVLESRLALYAKLYASSRE